MLVKPVEYFLNLDELLEAFKEKNPDALEIRKFYPKTNFVTILGDRFEQVFVAIGITKRHISCL